MNRLSEDMRRWRAERPDEWKMDEFIRGVESIEKSLEISRKDAFDFEQSFRECQQVAANHHNKAWSLEQQLAEAREAETKIINIAYGYIPRAEVYDFENELKSIGRITKPE